MLSFAFEAVAKGTFCEGMTLQIEHKPLQATMQSSAASSLPWIFRTYGARIAGASDFELLPDAPLVLDEIEFERADDGEG